MLKKTILGLAMLCISSGAAFAQNAASGGGAGVATKNYVPLHNGPGELQAYIALASGGIVATQATDHCLAGDIWLIANIGLPGPSIDLGQTDGTATGCACTHSGAYDASAATRVQGAIAIVAAREIAVPAGFPASWELRIEAANEQQLRGTDACGVGP